MGLTSPADLFDHIHPQEDEVTIYGFRTNEDYSQTLSWHVHDDGRVHCLHLPQGCCGECVEADSRLLRRRGAVVVVRPGSQFSAADKPRRSDELHRTLCAYNFDRGAPCDCDGATVLAELGTLRAEVGFPRCDNA